MAKASGYSWANKFLSRESFTGFYGHLFVLFDENQQGPYFQPMIFYPNWAISQNAHLIVVCFAIQRNFSKILQVDNLVN